MTLADRLPAIFVTAVVLGGIGVMVWQFVSPSTDAVTVSVKIPELSARARSGQAAYDANCSACHGPSGSGSDQGPPLVHDIYNPGHHVDQAFMLAVKRGTRQHHWQFGDMPAQPQVTDAEIGNIVQYIREIQRENGIRFQQHRM